MERRRSRGRTGSGATAAQEPTAAASEQQSGIAAIGREYRAASEADVRARDRVSAPSPLAGLAYDAERREYDLHAFVSSPVDASIGAFVEVCVHQTDQERASIRAALTMDDLYTLWHFARRSALLALRSRDATFVATGLAALTLIELERFDWRDAVTAADLFRFACQSLCLDEVPVFVEAARLSTQGMADLLARHMHAPLDPTGRWGYRLYATDTGLGLARDHFYPFTPSIDWAALVRAITALLAKDGWRITDVVTGERVPVVWLRRGQDAALQAAVEAVRGCVLLHCLVRGAVARRDRARWMLVILAEAATEADAAVLRDAAGPDGGGAVVLAESARTVCVVLVAHSWVRRVAGRECGSSLDRFRPELVDILAHELQPEPDVCGPACTASTA